MDLQRGSQWATIGSFFVGLVGVLLLLWQMDQPKFADPTQAQPTAPATAPASVSPSAMDWIPIGLIVFGIVIGGAMHLLAMRQRPASTSLGGSQGSAPRLEVTTTGYPKPVDINSSVTLIAWRNKEDPREGGKVDLVQGSIHVELWNKSGRGRTNKTRQLRFK